MCSFQTLSAARAEADTIRLLGESQAKSREMIGLAEAEGMRLKATSYKQYGEAATLSLVLDILPRVRLPLFYAQRRLSLALPFTPPPPIAASDAFCSTHTINSTYKLVLIVTIVRPHTSIEY